MCVYIYIYIFIFCVCVCVCVCVQTGMNINNIYMYINGQVPYSERWARSGDVDVTITNSRRSNLFMNTDICIYVCV